MCCRISGPMIRSGSDTAWRCWIPLWIRWILHCTGWSQLRCLVLLWWWWIWTHRWMNSCRILHSVNRLMLLIFKIFGWWRSKWQKVQFSQIALLKLIFIATKKCHSSQYFFNSRDCLKWSHLLHKLHSIISLSQSQNHWWMNFWNNWKRNPGV